MIKLVLLTLLLWACHSGANEVAPLTIPPVEPPCVPEMQYAVQLDTQVAEKVNRAAMNVSLVIYGRLNSYPVVLVLSNNQTSAVKTFLVCKDDVVYRVDVQCVTTEIYVKQIDVFDPDSTRRFYFQYEGWLTPYEQRRGFPCDASLPERHIVHKGILLHSKEAKVTYRINMNLSPVINDGLEPRVMIVVNGKKPNCIEQPECQQFDYLYSSYAAMDFKGNLEGSKEFLLDLEDVGEIFEIYLWCNSADSIHIESVGIFNTATAGESMFNNKRWLGKKSKYVKERLILVSEQEMEGV